MQALTIHPAPANSRLPYTLLPTIIPSPIHPLPPTHVAIEVVCAGVNRADILQARGLYPPPPGESELLGLEVSGIVRAVGAGVTHLVAGQRVAALLSGGGYAELVHAPACQAVPLPPSWSFVMGAAFPEAFATAYMALGVEGGLHAGDTVLVTGGASGVGCAAIQLAKLAGARVIASAGTVEKGEVCSRLGADFFLNYRDEDIAERVAEVTNGRGVDLLLDVVGGERFAEHLLLLARGGRLVSIGFLGGKRGEVDLSRLIRERLRIVGTNLRSRTVEEKGALVRGVWTMIEEKVQEGTLIPQVDTVFPMERANEAHERMLDNKNIGKLIIQIRPEVRDGEYGC